MQGEGATHHEQLHKRMQRREKEAKPGSLQRPEEAWSAVPGRRMLRPEPRPAEESPRAAPGHTTSQPQPMTYPTPLHSKSSTRPSLFSDHCRLSPTSRPSHMLSLCLECSLCILHMAHSSCSSGLSLNVTSCLWPNQRGVPQLFSGTPFAVIQIRIYLFAYLFIICHPK